MRRLPPLRALLCFESVANFSSFSEAAEDMCITHGAISHQIKALEEWLGKDLFSRHRTGVVLTKEGELLRDACSISLSRLEERCSIIRNSISDRTLTIACSSSFLAYWLLPRFEQFSLKNPEIIINFQTRAGITELLSGKIDILIVSNGELSFPDISSTNLTYDYIGPVCASSYEPYPKDPNEIVKSSIIHATSRSNAWEEWGKAAEVEVNCLSGLSFESLSLALEAARSGLGLCMAPKILVQRDLIEGRLVAPLGFVKVERSTFIYIKNIAGVDAKLFHQWLVEVV